MRKLLLVIFFISILILKLFTKENNIILQRVKWKVQNFYTLKEIWKYEFNSKKYGNALKDNPFPLLVRNMIVFNTDKGLIIYSLENNKIINFYENFLYFNNYINEDLIILANKDIIKLVNLMRNETIWEIKNSIPDIQRIYITNDKIIAISLNLDLLCLNKDDGKILWEKNFQKQIVNKSNNNKMRELSDGAFYQFKSLSNFIFYNNKLVFGTVSGKIYYLSLINGEVDWEINIEYPANGTIVLLNEKIYLGTVNGKIGIFSYKNKYEFLNISEDNEIRSLIINKDKIYGIGIGKIYILDIKNNIINWIITGMGESYPENIFIAKNYLWKTPVNYYDSGYIYIGFNLEDINKSVIYFEPEGRGYGPMEVSQGMLKNDKNINRFKKNHFVEWNDSLILVEPDKIISYTIVPM